MSTQSKYIWYDGRFVPSRKAVVPFLTHSLHYGSGVFEGIRFYETPQGPAVFRLSDHMKRLFLSARVMGYTVRFSEKEMERAIIALVKKNGFRSGYIRPMIWYGEKMGLEPHGAPVHAACACWPWGKYLAKETVNVCISRFVRVHPRSSVMSAKVSGTYANSVLASLDAHQRGYDEALLLDREGTIAEGPGENIFFVKRNTLVTPPLGAILPGITRDSIKTIARDLGFSVKERRVKPRDLRSFDEAFFCGTAAEVNAIARIEKVIFAGGKEGSVTKKLREAYTDVVTGKNRKYLRWLSY